MIDAVREKILLLIEPLFDEQGFELIAVDCTRGRHDYMIQILTDKPCGGITIEECSGLHQKIRARFDQENILEGNYTLEVSSPGIDRPLLTAKDFARSYGKEVTVYLKEPVGGRLEYRGVIKRIDDEHVYLQYRDADVMLAFKFINKAKHVI